MQKRVEFDFEVLTSLPIDSMVDCYMIRSNKLLKSGSFCSSLIEMIHVACHMLNWAILTNDYVLLGAVHIHLWMFEADFGWKEWSDSNWRYYWCFFFYFQAEHSIIKRFTCFYEFWGWRKFQDSVSARIS